MKNQRSPLSSFIVFTLVIFLTLSTIFVFPHHGESSFFEILLTSTSVLPIIPENSVQPFTSDVMNPTETKLVSDGVLPIIPEGSILTV